MPQTQTTFLKTLPKAFHPPSLHNIDLVTKNSATLPPMEELRDIFKKYNTNNDNQLCREALRVMLGLPNWTQLTTWRVVIGKSVFPLRPDHECCSIKHLNPKIVSTEGMIKAINFWLRRKPLQQFFIHVRIQILYWRISIHRLNYSFVVDMVS